MPKITREATRKLDLDYRTTFLGMYLVSEGWFGSLILFQLFRVPQTNLSLMCVSQIRHSSADNNYWQRSDLGDKMAAAN